MFYNNDAKNNVRNRTILYIYKDLSVMNLSSSANDF